MEVKKAITLVLTLSLSTCCGEHELVRYNVQFANYNPTTANADAVKKVLADVIDDNDNDVRVRPRVNQSDAVTVNVEFTPVNVVTLDTTEQRLDVLGYFTLTWRDELLVWNTSAYGGVNVIQMPLSQVWRPKLVLLKAFHSNNVIGDVKLDDVTVRMLEEENVAEVHWVPEGIYSVLCELQVTFYLFDIQDCFLSLYVEGETFNTVHLHGAASVSFARYLDIADVLCELQVTFYPFDIQDCFLSLYVADETLNTVHLHSAASVSTADYIENAEWRLLNVKSGMYTKYNTHVVYVDFRLERRAQFTLYTIMIPLLLLSVLDVAGFLITVESGEKIGYMVTLFLTFGFFVFILRDGLPHNSLQVSYFLVLLLQLSFVSVVSVIYAILETRIFQSWGDKLFRAATNRVDIENSSPVDDKKGTGSKTGRAKSGKSTNVHSTGIRSDTKSANKAKDNGNGSSKVDNGYISGKGGKAVSSSMEIMMESGGEAEPMTWGEVLRKLDFVMFVIFSVLVFIFSLFFFATVLNR